MNERQTKLESLVSQMMASINSEVDEISDKINPGFTQNPAEIQIVTEMLDKAGNDLLAVSQTIRNFFQVIGNRQN